MNRELERKVGAYTATAGREHGVGAVGKRTLTEGLVHLQPAAEVSGRAPGADWRGLVEGANQTASHAPAAGVVHRVEAVTGADLSGTRVHTGAQSDAAARSISARAFAVGSHVHFAAGEYRPGSADGDRLLAHELAHAAQHSDGVPHARLELGAVGDAAEVEADAIADRATAGPCATCGGEGCQCGTKPTATISTARTVSRSVVRREGNPGAAPVPGAPSGPPAGSDTTGPAVPQPAGGAAPGTPGATVPGACPDPAEQQRKEDFRRRLDLHVDNNIPSTGIGKFDARYFPSAGLMPVSVKIHFDFVQADNTPGFSERMRRLLRGQSNAMFFWSDAEKSTYVSEFVARVTARWSNQHTIRSIKPCWTEFFAIPVVTPVQHADKGSAHFAVTVHKSAGPGIDYKSAVNNEHLLNPARQPTADFWQSDNREDPNFNSASVATTERQRLETALTTAAASPVQFAQGADNAPASRAALQAFAAAANQANPSAPMVPINIDGFASPEGNPADNTDLSRRRAEHVANVLRGTGMRQPLRVTPRGPVGAPNEAASRRVDVVVDTAFEATYASNRYSVSEHEFGHMLGNPDEYSNTTTGPLAGVQTRYDGLVSSAGLSAVTYGQNTSSQMSAGVDVLPRHYVTLWEALGRMTSPTLAQADWSLTA